MNFISDGIYDTGDGVMHHLIAKYSWKHPALLLDHWGKPLYTLFSSPFAQFGYKGSVVFNIITLCATAFLTWKIAERMNIPFAGFAPLLVISAPIMLPVGMSGLTEPFFAFILVSGIYILLSGRAGLAAIIISFLPFARTEGFFLVPLFALIFAMKKDFSSVFLLATGTVLYSIIGLICKHDLLWVIHENPYRGAEKIYGHGGLFDLVGKNEYVWGWGMTALLAVGILLYPFHKKLRVNIPGNEFVIIGGCFLVFLMMHSVFWWKGLFGSLGLHRVLACTIPLAVIISLRALQLLRSLIPNRALSIFLLSAVTGTQLFLVWKQHPLPFKISWQDRGKMNTVNFLSQKGMQKNKVFCADPFFAMLTNKDPWDKTLWEQFNCTCPEMNFKNGDLIIWETHFAQFDIPFPVQLLTMDLRFREIYRTGQIPKDKSEADKKSAVVVFEYNVEKSSELADK